MTIHVVQRGETLSSIAGEYGVDQARLAADNAVPVTGALAVGQTLVIRFPRRVHTVAAGESLYSIARSYGVSVRQLWRNNPTLEGGTALRPGQVLVISTHRRPLGSGFFYGYAYPFIFPELLRSVLPFQSALVPFTYGITAAGGLLPLNDDALLAAARSRDVLPVMHLSTYTEEDRFDTDRAARVLTDPALQEALTAEILSTAQRKGYAGVDVDFEYLPGELAGAYAAFLARLGRLLRSRGLFLWAALAPKTSAAQRGLLYEGHDYAAVGTAVDAVLVMTYEWGYTAGPPMAVSPVPNIRAVLDYAVTAVPPEKIFLGMSNYGYDWPLPFRPGVTQARSISNEEAVQLAIRHNIAIQFDDAAQAPFFHYTAADGAVHEVWFEDARSVEARLALVAEYGLRGAGFWNLMRPSAQTWAVLAELYNIQP